MAQGHHLRIRLFLEGVEVPVVATSIQVAANVPATASIQVIATDKVLDLLPRTVIHLFYYDYVEAGHVALDRKKANLSKESYEDWFNSRYKLLFMGELVTIKFQKQTGQRAVVLECADFSNYWDTTFQYNFNGSLFGGRRKAAFIGANSNFFTSPLGHGTGTISRLLNGRSVNFPELRGLLAGVVRMLEAIGGSYYGKNTFRGCNDFTSIAELRLKILQQITAAEKDTSTAKLFARKSFNAWMNRSTQSLGQLVSFRGLVKTCFGFIFHEVYPCPVAKYVPAGNRSETRKWNVGLHQSNKYAGFAAKARNSLNLVNTAREWLGNWRQAVAGDGNPPAFASAYVRSWIAAEKSVNELYALGAATAPKGAQKGLAIIKEKMGKIRALSVNNGLISANWGPGYGTLDRNYSQIDIEYQGIITALKDILGIRLARSKNVTVDTQPRVNNQIFRPDVWFTAPPRCNVLFPEMYNQFDFSRQYLREVSRIELQTHNEILGNDALFNGRYYAPNVEDVRRGAKLSSRRFARIIMDHELYTGIIPMFENMSEANLFAMRSGKVNKSGAKVSYAQRAVNFQYFKYRFDSRAMSASGRFNPQFVAGFPSLIIDRPMTQKDLLISSLPTAEQIKALEDAGKTVGENTSRGEILKELVGPQYLGVCASLSHVVSQGGGITSYQFMQARVHRESTEFLGVDKVDTYKQVGPGITDTIVATPEGSPPKIGGRGPKGGKITRIIPMSSFVKGRIFPVLGNGTRVIIGELYPEPTYKPAYFEIFQDRSIMLKAEAYSVKEGYTRYVKSGQADLPMEEAVAPPWIWDGWRVPKINETYDQILGTTSITDISGYSAMQTDESGAQRFYVGDDQQAVIQDQNDVYASGKGKRSIASKTDTRSQEINKAKKNSKSLFLMDNELTVENSVDYLVRAYSFVKANNLDVGDFLKSYGWRPVATMVDILGGQDLEIKQVTRKARKVVKQKFLKKEAVVVTYGLEEKDPIYPFEVTPKSYLPKDFNTETEVLAKAVYGTRYVTKLVDQIGYEAVGKEGFHSRAYGDVEDLFGLVSPTVKKVLRLSQGKQRKVAARLDVRKRRRAAVKLYVAELTHSKGLLG